MLRRQVYCMRAAPNRVTLLESYEQEANDGQKEIDCASYYNTGPLEMLRDDFCCFQVLVWLDKQALSLLLSCMEIVGKVN